MEQLSEKRDIIVIGASMGGFEALKTLAAGMPDGLQAALFVVWHMAPDAPGVLASVLERASPLPAAPAVDYQAIVPGRIYVAPPDHHLLIERGDQHGVVRVTRGPRENRFRPAIDPLFRSAAYAYGSRVVGVILSGSLDDGTAGLWSIKRRGGLAVVQDPQDAQVASMPQSAMRNVAVDHVVPVAELAALLVALTNEALPAVEATMTTPDEKTPLEIGVAAGEPGLGLKLLELGELSPYSCPECHGVLAAFTDDQRKRFRCHTGHAYSADSLLAAVTENIEDSLYSAMRGIDESVMLLNNVGDHLAEHNQPRLAALYFQKAREAQARAQLLRQTTTEHENLSRDGLAHELLAAAGDS